jgi:hypothetical protein
MERNFFQSGLILKRGVPCPARFVIKSVTPDSAIGKGRRDKRFAPRVVVKGYAQVAICKTFTRHSLDIC